MTIEKINSGLIVFGRERISATEEASEADL